MRNLILSLVLLVIAGNLLASRSINNANEGIRYVNIDSCLTQWSEYNVVRDQLAEETRAVTAQLSEQAAAIQLKRDELELLDPASQATTDLILQISIAEETLQFQNQIASRQMQERSSTAFARALVAINQACAVLGEQEGYSAIVTIPAELDRQYPDSATKLSQLGSRVVNWTNPAFDVSTQVVEILNQKNQ